jgi:hypothetical protein
VDTFTVPWVLSTSLIRAMLEEGIITKGTIEKLVRNMRTEADRYAAAGHPADAGAIRRDADDIERDHLSESSAG